MKKLSILLVVLIGLTFNATAQTDPINFNTVTSSFPKHPIYFDGTWDMMYQSTKEKVRTGQILFGEKTVFINYNNPLEVLGLTDLTLIETKGSNEIYRCYNGSRECEIIISDYAFRISINKVRHNLGFDFYERIIDLYNIIR